MADRIKGITIEIGGDTTGLNKALSGVNKEISSTQSQLKDVSRLLKLDPSNTELLSQKQKLLSQAVNDTKEKLETLKTAEAQAQEQFKEGKISEEQYDALKREIIATEEQLKSLETQAEKSNVTLQKIGELGGKFQEAGEKITDAGKKFLPVTAAITAAGGASAKMAMDFEDAMAKVSTIADTTEVPLSDLQQSIIDLSNQTGISSSEIASNVYDAISAGQKTGDAVNFVSNSTKLAKAGFTDAGSALDVLTTIMNSYGLEASEVNKVSDVLIQTQNLGKTTVGELSSSMGKIIPTAKANGVALEQVAAGYATMTAKGVATAETTTYMNSMLNELGKSGTKVSTTLTKKTGKSFKELMDSGSSLADVLDIVSDGAEEQGLAFSDLWGSAEAGKAALILLGDGAEGFNGTLKQMQDSTGATEEAFGKLDTKSFELQKTVNQLKNDAIELGQSILEVLAPIFEKLSQKIQELHEWFSGLDDSQKEMIVKIGLIVAAIGPLLIVIGQMATGIGAIMTAVSTLGPMLAALSAAGGPILLTVAAVGALAAIFNDAADYTSDYYLKARDLTDQETENKTKVDELYESYDLLNQRRQDAVESVNTQTQYEQNLFDELQNITDENGNVKEGYEERAAFIVGELSSALGTEISMTGNQIDKYDEMCNSIDRLIEKKQANALLAANEAAYTEAIKNQADAFMAYNDAQKSVEDTKKSLSNAQRWEEEYQTRINALLEKNIRTGEDVSYQTQELADKMYACGEEAKGYEEKLAGQEQTLKDAETAYVGYNTTISNYEGLSSAIISGDQQKISDAVLMAANSFQTAETSTKESLERQVQEFTQKYTEMQAAVNAGAPGVTQAQADNMKTLVEMSRKELGELPGTVEKPVLDMINVLDAKKALLGEAGKATGKDYTSGAAGGIAEGTGDVVNAAGDMAEAGIDATRAALDSHSPSRVTHEIGLDFDDGFSGGIQEGTAKVTGAVASVTTAATGALSAGLKTSQTTTQTYQTTMSSSWTTWATGLASQLKTTLAEISTATDSNMSEVNTTIDTKMRSLSQTWAQRWKEIQDKHRETVEKIQELHEKTLSDMEELNRKKTEAMKEGAIQSMQELSRGVKQELDKLPAIVEEGFAPAISYITSLADKSAGWGDDMMSGYIRGMKRKMRDLERACEEAADIVSDYLHHTTPEKGPMKDDDTWMPDMMQGFAGGIRKNRNLLLDQMKALTKDMALTMPNAGTMVKQPVTLKNYNVLALDGKVIADNINEQLGILL